ncbi:MAG: CvpA family protein [Dehalococcoidia bacterium]|jgi:membrane protein required for colicin V production|nr:CvpA family protein [Dehalococcoidia bacterium]MDP7470207.1 CvpA family protein [Dehalococcoidia bacterium]
MNWLDLVLLVILGFATLWGLRKGLITVVIPTVGMIVGVVLASRLYPTIADSLFNSEAAVAKVGAFIIVLVAVMVVASIVSKILIGMVSLAMLGWVNRLAGGAVGLLLSVVALGAVMALVARFSFLGLDSAVKDSTLAALLIERFPLVLALLPGEFDLLRSFFS